MPGEMSKERYGVVTHINIYICLEKIIVSCNALKKIFF